MRGMMVAAAALAAMGAMTSAQAQSFMDAPTPALAPSTADPVQVSAARQSMRDAFEGAYWRNPEILAARAELEGIGESLPQARAGAMPTLNFAGSAGMSRTLSNTNSNSAPVSIGLNAALPLYDGGRVANAVDAAIEGIEAARAAHQALEQRALLTAATAYLDVLRDRELLRLAQDSARALAELTEATRFRFEVGEITRTDVAAAEARLASAQAAAARARAAAMGSAAVFERVVGVAPGLLQAPASFPTLPGGRKAAEDMAAIDNPAVAVARARERAAMADIRRQMAGLLPTATLNSSVSGTRNLATDADSASIGLTLNLNAPIFDGGANYSRVRAARATATQRRLEIQSAERSARESAALAWRGVESASAQIQAAREQVRAAELAYEGASEELKVGARATLDVLNAENDRTTARSALVSAVHDLHVAIYQLMQATGALTPEAVGAGESYGRTAALGAHGIFGYPRDEMTRWRFPWRP